MCKPKIHPITSVKSISHVFTDDLIALEEDLAKANDKIKRLEARGISDMQWNIELFIKAQQAKPTICAHIDGGWVWSNCPECGVDVKLDEEGCCLMCGRYAIWYGKREVQLP